MTDATVLASLAAFFAGFCSGFVFGMGYFTDYKVRRPDRKTRRYFADYRR